MQVKHEEAKTSTQLPPGGMTCRPLGTDKVTSVSKVRASRSVRAGMLLMNVTDPPASTLTASGVVTCEITTVAVGAAPAGGQQRDGQERNEDGGQRGHDCPAHSGRPRVRFECGRHV